MSKHDDAYEISRRDFATRLGGVAAAAMVAGRDLAAAPLADTKTVTPARVIGANDRVVLASIGVRGQGNSLKRGFARLKNVEIKTLCDIDANLADERINDPKLSDVPTFKPTFVQDLRRVLDDKDIDGVIIATPNHWHALATIWALQAGKHVYVEKPASHTVWEGRKMVEAATKYNRVVQVGTMNRSRPAVQKAIEFIKGGGIGKVYMARGLCFKRRPGIGKYPDGPMAAGEQYKLNVESKTIRAGRTTRPICRRWTTTSGSARHRSGRSTGTASTTTGTGTGTTATATPATRGRTSSTSRAGASARTSIPCASSRVAATSARPRRRRRPTPTRRRSSTQTGRCSSSPRAARTRTTKARRRSATCSTEPKGWVWIDGDGAKWQAYHGAKDDKGEGGDRRRPSGGGSDPNVLTSIEFPHYQNFVDALRANDPKILTCDILEGHLSSTLPHLCEYRVPQQALPRVRRQVGDGSGTTRTPTSC